MHVLAASSLHQAVNSLQYSSKKEFLRGVTLVPGFSLNKLQKLVRELLRSELVSLCYSNFCSDQGTISCLGVFHLSVFSTRLDIILVVIFFRKVPFLSICYTNPFFKVKFDLESEVGDSNTGGGGVRPLFATSCTLVSLD